MKVNVYINDQFYKAVEVAGDSYNPNFIYPQIVADKEAGLLDAFNIQEQLGIKIEKAE